MVPYNRANQCKLPNILYMTKFKYFIFLQSMPLSSAEAEKWKWKNSVVGIPCAHRFILSSLYLTPLNPHAPHYFTFLICFHSNVKQASTEETERMPLLAHLLPSICDTISFFNPLHRVLYYFQYCCVHVSGWIWIHIFVLGIHKLKASLPPRDPKSVRAQPFDPIPPVAKQISSQWWLLCFDEFQVTYYFEASNTISHTILRC